MLQSYCALIRAFLPLAMISDFQFVHCVGVKVNQFVHYFCGAS